MRLLLNLFKLRIGVAIALAAVAGLAVTPGALGAWQAVVLTLAVLVSQCRRGTPSVPAPIRNTATPDIESVQAKH